MNKALAKNTPLQSATAIGRRELLLWIIVFLFANLVLHLLDTGSLDAFVTSLLAQNTICWFACVVTIYRLHLGDPTAPAGRLDWTVTFVLVALTILSSFVPYQFGIGLLTTAVAFYLLTFNHGDRNLKATGSVLLALSAQLVWGLIFFRLFTPELLKADAVLVGTTLTELRPDIIWSGTTFFGPDGHTVTLIAACSSFNNVSAAILACAAVAMLKGTEWVRRDIATMFIAIVAMIFINAARICLLVWSRDYHLFWHGGAGVQILAVIQTLVVFAIAWWGARAPRHAT